VPIDVPGLLAALPPQGRLHVDAMEHLRAGKARYRIVLVNDIA
jgi:hypothetical protein